MGRRLTWEILLSANVLIVLSVALAETYLVKGIAVKYIKYDRIDLCRKSQRKEMIEDIEKRLDIKIIDLTIGDINF